ncbi:HesA/MoeB/ThiF family protein related to EC-YgdL [Thioalkalivibrio nitratireducens DSM 14787]|uniref:HesA/MoeB/ThiF family protein related to EC-YgdL n=1 Tax=Thioalkalivibrio nitratireducens (strain DSM 14787 / UNIQEM 213 / ALEN2) TaxID=1255043 RepID=L0E237_THIND|nr:tRNA threonylcarbamoyladenosine dehydratase [Thioalkalivibrio nitratireducens]AGA35275.1 HesA/MoeB/ThiF family protein related to EC-YgdL [Thioalkalivibrio nitratireducens DSM 14787]
MIDPEGPYAERTRLLVGADGLAALRRSHVFIAGLGGVGSYAAEAIARAGIGRITLLDHDAVSPSNLNRQLVALRSTLDRPKVEVMAARIADIDPGIDVQFSTVFLRPDGIRDHVPVDADYVIDCIDSIACKAALVAACQARGQQVISSMGAGGRLDPTVIRVGPLVATRMCPLARQMRKRLKRMRASLEYPVVYSLEQPRKGTEHRPIDGPVPGRARSVNGTISHLPALFGLTAAGCVIRGLLDRDRTAPL